MQLTQNQRLKIERKRKNLTQDEVSKALGIGRPTYTNIERSTSDEVNIYYLQVLNEKYGFDVDYIVGNAANSQSNLKHTKPTQEIPQWKEMMEMMFDLKGAVNKLEKDVMFIKGRVGFKPGVVINAGKEVPLNGQWVSEKIAAGQDF